MIRYTNTRKKKGVSPVIASIILIAVTIAIAIAVAGWIFGLFSTYTSGPALNVKDSTLEAATGILTVEVINSGAKSVTAVSVDAGSLNYQPDTSIPPADTVKGNADNALIFEVEPPTIAADIILGQTYTFVIHFNDGSSLTVVATAE